MNIFSGKVVAIKDGQGGPWMPGVGAGFVVRTNDRFVTGALDQSFTGTLKSYTNEDVYVAVTKTWLHPPVPFLVNFGWKATNASIYGLGGQSTRFCGPPVRRTGDPAAGALPDRYRAGCRALRRSRHMKNLRAILCREAGRICPLRWTTRCV